MVHRSGLPAHIEFFRRYEKGNAKMGDQRPLLSWICETRSRTWGNRLFRFGIYVVGISLGEPLWKAIAKLFSRANRYALSSEPGM